MHTVFEGLVAHRADLSVGGALARSWEVEDGGRTYRFTLRDGVTFHNGEPLTSAEVKWTWDRMFGGDAWKCKSTFAGRSGVTVTAVEAPDPKTVRSEEHTSELQSLMRISYAVFCLKKKNTK